MNIELYLKNKLEEDIYDINLANRFIELYENIPSENLRKIFSIIHYNINDLFKYLNQRITTGHYTAHESRELIKWIKEVEELKYTLINTDYSFEIEPYYNKLFDKCNEFLQISGGSPLPDNIESVKLIIADPIFLLAKTAQIVRKDITSTFSLKQIGFGSYAKVFKYKDDYYGKYFAIKRANNDLSAKEYERFKREYDSMKKLCSPYVVDVYNFNDEKNEYTMEYMDETLFKYISENNAKLTKEKRKTLIFQVLKAFEYIHSKGLLHRDISLTNIMLKHYEDVSVVKVSDFGLVKIPESDLTSTLTELKGSLNDRSLEIYGFSKYDIRHETYALTRLVYFILTGRTTLEKFESAEMETFIKRGLDNNLNKRYQNVMEIREALNKV